MLRWARISLRCACNSAAAPQSHLFRRAAPDTTVEVLTPDFRRKEGAIEAVADARPDVYNHNLESVPSLYRRVRPGANYKHSLALLARVKERVPETFTKSGIMLGLGEELAEVETVMDDLRSHDVDFLTIGQYLQPTRNHLPIDRWVTPAQFDAYRAEGLARGFDVVESGPLVRSSYHAEEQAARLALNDE